MTYKLIHVGAGGFGWQWCHAFLPPFIEEGAIDVAAVVDVDPEALAHGATALGVPPQRRYTDLARAFDENAADFCTIVIPPAFHEDVVDQALAHDMHILSEKPIADTLSASVRVADKAERAGRKMGVTMSHRFDQDKLTLREALRSGRYGALDYLVGRFTASYRAFGDWGAFRHQMADPLLIDGAVHHLDILADLVGAPCETVYARTWKPRWAPFAGDTQALVTMQFENGAHALYEGALVNAVSLNNWTDEYIRAECEEATLVLDHREVTRLAGDPEKGRAAREGRGETVALLEGTRWRHARLIHDFLKWLDGGEPMETNVADNLRSTALVFAAVESSRTNRPVCLSAFLDHARNSV